MENTMQREALLEQIKNGYRESFDLSEPYRVGDHFYDALCSFRVTSARYVLVEQAELWRAHCFEYALLQSLPELSAHETDSLMEDVEQFLEPQLVRGGKKVPEKDHMYSYMTVVYVADHVTPEAAARVKKLRFFKSYRFQLRGYSELRVLVFDLEHGTIFGNPAARELVSGYRKNWNLKQKRKLEQQADRAEKQKL